MQATSNGVGRCADGSEVMCLQQLQALTVVDRWPAIALSRIVRTSPLVSLVLSAVERVVLMMVNA